MTKFINHIIFKTIRIQDFKLSTLLPYAKKNKLETFGFFVSILGMFIVGLKNALGFMIWFIGSVIWIGFAKKEKKIFLRLKYIIFAIQELIFSIIWFFNN